MKTIGSLMHEETHHFHARLALVQMLLAPFPLFVGNRVRAAGLRWVGCDVGHGTVFWGLPVLTGGAGFAQRLHIGAQCWFNAGCRFDLSDHITIHDGVALGHGLVPAAPFCPVSLLELGRSSRQARLSPAMFHHTRWLAASLPSPLKRFLSLRKKERGHAAAQSTNERYQFGINLVTGLW